MSGAPTGPVVFLAGGGTGGHVFPLVALAHALRRQRPEIRPVFIGTARGMETRFVPEQGFELELLDVLPIRGGGLGGALRGALRAAALLPESRALIRRYDAAAVFSIGGYAAGPVSAAARTLGLPLALMEPNSVIGLANKILAPFVSRAYTAFPEAELAFSPSIVRARGVPLRPGFDPRPYRTQSGPLRVLVLGGSQGAKALNELLPEALARIEWPLTVTHQCGGAHVDAVEGIYRRVTEHSRGQLRLTDVTIEPFIEDMPAALGEADLVIGRSGASAVSEIAAIGRPSLLIAYPFASGDHQRKNAQSLEKAGAARALDEKDASVARIADEVRLLAENRAQLTHMAAAAQAVGRPHAADEIARDFLELATIQPIGLSSDPVASTSLSAIVNGDGA